MKLSSFTCLAFLVNRVIDAAPETSLSFKEIFDAADEGRLIPLLVGRYGHIANFTWVTEACFRDLEQMEAALRDAAAAFEGRVGKPSRPLSGLSLVMDIILEAIQRPFPPPHPGARTSARFLDHSNIPMFLYHDIPHSRARFSRTQ